MALDKNEGDAETCPVERDSTASGADPKSFIISVYVPRYASKRDAQPQQRKTRGTDGGPFQFCCSE